MSSSLCFLALPLDNKASDPKPDSNSPSWISVDEAAVLIQEHCDIGPKRAAAMLSQACASGKVQTKFVAAMFDQQKILIENISPSEWKHPVLNPIDRTGIDLRSGRVHSLECYPGDISINSDELKQWLTRPGPKRGAIDRYQADDRALYTELERLKAQKNLLDTQAARLLAHKIKGNNSSEDSRVRRLVRRYRKDNNSH